MLSLLSGGDRFNTLVTAEKLPHGYNSIFYWKAVRAVQQSHMLSLYVKKKQSHV